jgi:tetratricopeptide (TPR) repeat protein
VVQAWPLTNQLEKSLLGYRTGEARTGVPEAKNLSEAAQELAWGRVLEQEKSYGEAAARLKKAQELAPKDAAPSIFLGETYLHAEDSGAASRAFSDAEKLARQALDADPKDGASQLWLGVALQRQKKFPEALEALDKARGMDPGSAYVVYQIGVTQAFVESWEEAVATLTEAIEKDSGIAYAYYYRGLAAGKIGRKDLLVNDLDRFLALAPEAPEAAAADKLIQSASR